jgi:hypothetical protein
MSNRLAEIICDGMPRGDNYSKHCEKRDVCFSARLIVSG